MQLLKVVGMVLLLSMIATTALFVMSAAAVIYILWVCCVALYAPLKVAAVSVYYTGRTAIFSAIHAVETAFLVIVVGLGLYVCLFGYVLYNVLTTGRFWND